MEAWSRMVELHGMEDPLVVWSRQGAVGLCEHILRLELVGVGGAMGGGDDGEEEGLMVEEHCT